MRTVLSTAICTVAIGLVGCAGTTAGPVTDESTDEGFRYYETSPFLLLYTDSKGGIKSEVLFLPDTTKLRSIKPYAYGASNKTTLTFDNGRLVKASTEVDETAIPKAVISGLEKIATSTIKAFNGGNAGLPGPYLFRIYQNEQGVWSLEGDIAYKEDGASKPSIINFKSN